MNKLLIRFLKDNDEKLQSSLSSLDSLSFPKLPQLSEHKLRHILGSLSQHKALACFPLPDEHLQIYTQKGCPILLLNRVWDPDFLTKHSEIFYCRLIPLNKAHPKVPRVDQMRPIVVTNPLYKLSESRFLKPLQDFFLSLEDFGRSNFGFLPHMTTQIPINNLLSKVTENRSREKSKMYFKTDNQLPRREEFVLYIDFESAYNSINLQLLFRHLLQLNIPNISHKDLTFLFCLISKLRIHLGDANFHPQFGVPQGGITSPILFNYAMYFVIQSTMETINLKITNSCLDTPIKRKQSLLAYKFQHNDVFTWADDLAIRFSAVYGAESKLLLKVILE